MSENSKHNAGDLPHVPPAHMVEYAQSIASVPFFEPDGNPDPSWRLFVGPTWIQARTLAFKAMRADFGEGEGHEYQLAWESAVDAGLHAAMNVAAKANLCHPDSFNHAADITNLTGLVWRYVPKYANEIAEPLFSEEKPDHWRTVHAAQWDARLLMWMLAAIDLDIPQQYRDHAIARWTVWRKGYALMGDLNGVLYVYAKAK